MSGTRVLPCGPHVVRVLLRERGALTVRARRTPRDRRVVQVVR